MRADTSSLSIPLLYLTFSFNHRSLPDLSTRLNKDCEDLKREIEHLKIQLLSANNLIDELTLEKLHMQRKIDAQEQRIKRYAEICSDAPKINESMRSKNRGRNKKRERKKTLSKEKIESSLFNTNLTNIVSEDTSHPDEEETEKIKENYGINRNIIASTSLRKKKQIFILADQQGRGMQQTLQKLVGAEYDVFCYWKSHGTLQDVINTCENELNSLTKHDYIVVVGGFNEKNPLKLKTELLEWISAKSNTNLVICGLPCNSNMSSNYINYDIKMICQGFSNTVFVKMNYRYLRFGTKYFLTNICFSIYREISHISHSHTTNQNNIPNVNSTCESIDVHDGTCKIQDSHESNRKSHNKSFL